MTKKEKRNHQIVRDKARGLTQKHKIGIERARDIWVMMHRLKSGWPPEPLDADGNTGGPTALPQRVEHP